MTVSENRMPSFQGSGGSVPNWHTAVETMDEVSLLTRRSELTALSRERAEGLTLDETEELCAIYTRLRRGRANAKPAKPGAPKRRMAIDVGALPL